MIDLITQFRAALMEQLGAEPDPVIDQLLSELREVCPPELQPIQMWHVGSNEDEYFEGIVLASTAFRARKEAWAYFSESVRADECLGQPGGCNDADGGLLENPHEEWQHYHSSADGLFCSDRGDDVWAGSRGFDID